MSSRDGATRDMTRKPEADARAKDSNAEATKRNNKNAPALAPLNPAAASTKEKRASLAAAGDPHRPKRKTPLASLPLNLSEGADAAARQTSSSTSHQDGMMHGGSDAMAHHAPPPSLLHHPHAAAVAAIEEQQDGGSALSPHKRSKSDPAIAFPDQHQQRQQLGAASFPPMSHHHHRSGHDGGPNHESGSSRSRSHSPPQQPARATKLAKSSSELNISKSSQGGASQSGGSGGGGGPQLARQVNRFSAEELEYLDRKFRDHPTPNVQQREEIAADLSRRRMVSEYESIRGQGWPTELTQVQIKYWFDHQRRKIKKQRMASQQHQQHYLDQGMVLMNNYSMQAAAQAAAAAHAGGVGVGVSLGMGAAVRTNTPPPPRMPFSPPPPPPPGLPVGYNVHAATNAGMTAAAYGSHPYMHHHPLPQPPPQQQHNPVAGFKSEGLIRGSEAVQQHLVGARTSPTGVLPAFSSTLALGGFGAAAATVAGSGGGGGVMPPATVAQFPAPPPAAPTQQQVPALPRPGALPNPTGLGAPAAPPQDMWQGALAGAGAHSTALIQLWQALSMQNNGQMLQQFKVQNYQANELILQRHSQLDKGIFLLKGNLRVLYYGSAEDSDEVPAYSAVVNEGSFIGKPNVNVTQESGGMVIQAQTQCFVALIDQ